MVFFLVFAIAVLLAGSICWLLLRQTSDETHEIHEANETTEMTEPLASWHTYLDQFPGVLGWMVLRKDGVVIDASNGGSRTDLGPLLQGVLEQVVKSTETASGSKTPNLLSWEGENESLLIAPPRNLQTGVFLVLFLGREQYQSEIQNLLRQVNWEQK